MKGQRPGAREFSGLWRVTMADAEQAITDDQLLTRSRAGR
jgi:hypothetical protein